MGSSNATRYVDASVRDDDRREAHSGFSGIFLGVCIGLAIWLALALAFSARTWRATVSSPRPTPSVLVDWAFTPEMYSSLESWGRTLHFKLDNDLKCHWPNTSAFHA